MSFVLTHEDGTQIYPNHTMWCSAIQLALYANWSPAGTENPEGEGEQQEWNGSYTTSRGQRVADDDAANFAAALERVLPEIPEHDAMADKVVIRKLPDGQELRGVPEGVKFTPFEVWSGDNRAHLLRLIEFCHQGGFTIT